MDLILASPEREGFELLSGTAAAIWRLLGAPRSLGSLTGVLADTYETSPETIAGDVETLLQDLLRRGLVEEVLGNDA